MATNHHRQHHHPADHPGTTPPRHRACRAPCLTLQRARYVDLEDTQEGAAVAALADLLASYLDVPEGEAA